MMQIGNDYFFFKKTQIQNYFFLYIYFLSTYHHIKYIFLKLLFIIYIIEWGNETGNDMVYITKRFI